MLFTDASFIIGLVLLCIVYFLLPKKFRWMLLLCASLLFYAWSGIGYLLYIAATTVSTYFTAIALDRMGAARKDTLAAHKSDWSRDEKKAFKEAANKKRFRLLVNECVYPIFSAYRHPCRHQVRRVHDAESQQPDFPVRKGKCTPCAEFPASDGYIVLHLSDDGLRD